MKRTLFFASMLQLPGMIIGLAMLYNPNPHLLALFAFVGIPLIFLGMVMYIVTVLKELRRSRLL